ncbi:hypothetical protein A3A76_06145 [Candidatus Woesebacteria bacterium RIFCSPLOWO2_01_FULL_39_23]|uniref:Uncharacterized protein n=1 Tax=Candidatus Woesebacteria bacterium RIFCSPHIGHO2_01_FULL_40_22 TaxID=1802499 RepID=A0A1F7YI51_9BACT|nr:MAG: hypothetical protein A2628_06085 [Candidatus Woesebacteria bacterium RIFCSPHIGHO2_01_FULL_40_22]OGM63258.1 MAG: hypothetical protein A3A76_06145 [Candidatus Woesebacteria bacterium RIFCSPLOWO2_01_FULL_39_23]
MAEIIKGKKGADILLTDSGKKIYRSTRNLIRIAAMDRSLERKNAKVAEHVARVGIFAIRDVNDCDGVTRESVEEAVDVRNAISKCKLTEMEREVLYYLEQGLNLAEIGRIKSITRVRVGQLKNNIAKKIALQLGKL